MSRGRPMRRANGTGTVVKLSGRRRKPYEVRVNTRMDERNYPVYDVLGRFDNRETAAIALAEYRKDPYDINMRDKTFSEVYEKWFENKYYKSKKTFSNSTVNCTKMAFKHCSKLHNMKFADIRTIDMQNILDDYSLSHAYMEHLRNLFVQMYKYALEYDIVTKNYAAFTKITKEDDDKHGVPFTENDIRKIWHHVETVPFADTILIYIYSGFRVSELLTMPIDNIDLNKLTFKGGLKTRASKNRVVPIHSEIVPLVAKWKAKQTATLFSLNGKPLITRNVYGKLFSEALLACGITYPYTPHDCRHTLATFLNNAGANPVSVKKILGHSLGNDVTEKIYTHKDIDELRKAIELFKIQHE